MTGITRVSRESVFSDLNNLVVITTTSRHMRIVLDSQKKRSLMLNEYGLSEKKQEVKAWYDGITFGDRDIYNPWSILNYLKTGRFPRIGQTPAAIVL
ncbi:MAG: AAA family ATPase [Blautia sp.]